MAGEMLTPDEMRPEESSEAAVMYDLTAEQKASLALEMRICLALANNPSFQEEPHAAPEISEFFAAETDLKLDDSDEGKANKKLLQKANREIKDKLVDFQMIGGGIRPVLKKEGYASLDSEIEKAKKGSVKENGDVDALE